MVGRTISHYAIQELLGEGGMGVVYRAWDPRLNRNVAIKLLRADALADSERKKRFIQEARAASALNHPNIVTIFDIDTTADGTGLIVMEYVPGKTLHAHIRRHGLPIAEALKYAVQIADALTAAHEAGIIHRDLKPANIMLTEKGVVKLLDFGLAKLSEPSGQGAEAATQTLPSESPRTGEGIVLGTVAYMSPEQLQGLPLDTRSDIFSFGAVLYEMITGRSAFQGANKMSTVGAILRDEPPPITRTAEFVPAELERAIRRCLRKDREKRMQHISDLKLLLEEFKEDSESGRLVTSGLATAGPRRRSRWLLPVMAATCVCLGIAVSWLALRRHVPRAPVLLELTNDGGYSGMPALSPDGKLLAFVSDRAGDGRLNIWVKQVPAGEPVQITHGQAILRPDFSPDGTRLVYEQEDDHSINVIPALGGTPRRIASPGYAPRFSPDGRLVAYRVANDITYRDEIRLVPSGGGPPQVIRAPLARMVRVIWCGGQSLLVLGTRTSGWLQTDDPGLDWWAIPVVSSKAEPTGAVPKLRAAGFTGFAPVACLGDSILFEGQVGNKTQAWRLPVDSAFRPAGAPARLTSGAAVETDLAWSGSGLAAFAAINYSADNVWVLPVDADSAKATGELQRGTRTAGYDGVASVSSDGRLAVYLSNRTGNRDVWLKDFSSGREVQLTNTPGDEGRPAISPDGSRVAYTVKETAPRMRNWLLPVEGGVPELLCDDCGEIRGWFPDNHRLLLNIRAYTNHGAIGSFDLSTRQTRPIVEHPEFPVGRGRISPDGRWIAFEVTPLTNTRQVFVARLRDKPPVPSEWIAVTDGKTLENKPDWSPDGRWLYYVSERDGFRCVWARAFDPRSGTAKGEPVEVLHLHTSEKSMQPINFAFFDISVARDKIVFNAVESRANIQAIKLP